jgi:two-component system response regulator AtoC
MTSRQVRRILIVEDEKTLLYLLAQNFLDEPEDYEVVTVGSAEKAIELLAEREFGVIIADIVLPEMSGLELLERVRTMQPHARVILITGYGTLEVRERAQALGAFAYMDKPFPLPAITRAVLKAFGAEGAGVAPTGSDHEQVEGGGACTQ